MNSNQKQTLQSLFLESRHSEIISAAETIIMLSPQDLEAYYYSGMSLICSGQSVKGLQRLIAVIGRYAASEPGKLSDENKRVAGHAALQLAALLDGYEYRHLLGKYGYAAISKARQIAEELKDAALLEAANAMAGRFHPFTKTRNNRTFSGVYFIPDSPYMLQVEPTNICNIRCLMCPYTQMKRKKGYLDIGIWRAVLSSWSNRSKEITLTHFFTQTPVKILRPHGVKLFYMGDPLMHPQIDALIKEARQAATPCPIYIETNGLLLADAAVRAKLLAAQPSTIGISIDGVSEDTYNAVRKGSDWKTVSAAIVKLAEERRALGLEKQVTLSLATIVPNDSPQVRAQVAEFLGAVREAVDHVNFLLLNKLFRGGFYSDDASIMQYDDTPNDSLQEDAPVCIEPFEKLNVLWDGTVVPCCNDIEGSIVLGHARDGIDAVWRSEKTKALHDALLHDRCDSYPMCMRCYGNRGEAFASRPHTTKQP